MVLASFAAGALAANCYVISAAEAGPTPTDCVVIDPGMDAVEPLERVLEQHRLRPALVLLTHGHFDHVASAAEVADRYDAACYLAPADRAWLSDPLAALTADFAPLVTSYLDASPAAEPRSAGSRLPEPRRMAEPETGPDGIARLEAAGLVFELLPAAGHTPGSTLYTTSYRGAETSYELVFTGDVLFQGTIGRTDLPGGDPAAMDRTLSSTVSRCPDETVVLPGHGQRTTIGRERSTNPFLRQLR